MNNVKPKIDKGVPITPKVKTNTLVSLARGMEVGDSILFASARNARSFCVNGTAYTGRKFSLRKQSDNSYRVWRIS